MASQQKKRNRYILIGVALILSVGTALVLNTLDQSRHESRSQLLPEDNPTSLATLEALRTGPEQMVAGDYEGAIHTYEEQLERLDELPISSLAAYFGDLGLAHYYQGQTKLAENDTTQANEHFHQAAIMFEQASATATHDVIASVAEFYRLRALYAAEDYATARDVGEHFLTMQPEAAIASELLPQGVIGTVHELLTMSYFLLADETEDERTEVLQARGLEHAELALLDAPETVIQPYYYTGLAAWEEGNKTVAKDRLTKFLSQMEKIPEEHWEPEDVANVEQVRQLLAP